MKAKKTVLREEILCLVEESRMKLDNKLKLLWLMDEAFRDHMGPLYKKDNELEADDILSRSM